MQRLPQAVLESKCGYWICATGEPKGWLFANEETEQLVVALRKLPFRYREVIVLYYYEEYGTGEIAKMLHTSVNTVKSRLRRGREKLAAIMKN